MTAAFGLTGASHSRGGPNSNSSSWRCCRRPRPASFPGIYEVLSCSRADGEYYLYNKATTTVANTKREILLRRTYDRGDAASADGKYVYGSPTSTIQKHLRDKVVLWPNNQRTKRRGTEETARACFWVPICVL